ncbi:hypothetical protein [Janthinobacterium sp. GW458P]|uniref:hypothetical protein n=1 Tax=Janthinobacterium sp. GW458P TaxID=1981504 RepID=UPI000A320360|nr:hypothetical protein [Janthinobacterium sp. GW458P]MBE3025125.1 hypothetical protein [Janthinobacterium sp. GW458P]PHV16700.1 hypothetical protein CSQ90_13585 [Janthinobacterium sp. BJB303]
MSKTVEQAEAALAAANAAYLNELERDCIQRENCSSQQRDHEYYQQSLRDAIYQCKRELEEAKHRPLISTEVDNGSL